ncbi:hypothetical protein GCM10017673_01840 [Streptosporangium violaceochromogenes]|nr:hypothetical protein GCM10017673_01840 [Streptosporangium violaceochromogenes]
MGLSTREKRALGEIADRLHAEDPALAHSLMSFATGVITSEILPSRRRLLPVALLGVAMAVMAVALPVIAGTGHGAAPAAPTPPRG